MRILRGALLFIGGLILLSVLTIFLVPERWLANRMESAASNFLGAELRIGDLDLNRLSWTPSAQLSNLTLTNPENNEVANVGEFAVSVDVKRLFAGKLVFDRIVLTDSTLAYSADKAGDANWDFLMEALPSGDAKPEEQTPEQSGESMTLPAIRQLNVENVNVTLDDKATDNTADIVVSASGSTVSIAEPAMLNVEGSVNDEPVTLATTVTTLEPLTIPPENIEIDVEAALGGSTFSAAGTVTDIATLGDVDLDFEVAGNGLMELQNVIKVALPALPPFEIRGSVDKEDNFFVLRQFDGKMGNTTLAGDIRVDHTTTPITVYANVNSDPLDFEDFAGLVGAEPDSATADSDEDAEQTDEARLLPDGPIDLLPLTQFFNGAIDYQAQSVVSKTIPISRFDLRAEIDGLQMALAPASMDIANGKVSGSVNFDVSEETPKGVFELEVDRVSLKDLLEGAGVDDDSLGIIGGRMKFWVSGTTVSEIAANLDGGAFLLMTEGKLDALLSEFSGLDLFESLSLLINPEKSLTDIRCAYLELHSESGLLDISRLVIDTEDTVFLADGSVDLNDETLDVIVEPHPKDISVLAARTAVNIGGSFSEPSVSPGRSLPVRAAAAAVLATLGTPVLAVLPFIEAGTGEDSNYCSGLVSSLGETEAEAE